MKNMITTKKGDRGLTILSCGKRVTKDGPIVEALGSLDELSVALGTLRCQLNNYSMREFVSTLQKKVRDMSTEVSTPPIERRSMLQKLSERDVSDLEVELGKTEELIGCELHGFVYSGDSILGNTVDLARVAARRAERRLVALGTFSDWYFANKSAFAWINRLSDYLWLLARYYDDLQVSSE